jgi:O-antigen/teichoic acid export membrane protein
MKRIRNIIASNKSLVENFSLLSVLQIFSLMLPFFSYPYLIRVLGVEVYGKIVFAQAIISYFVILISFGFGTSGIISVSINRNNKDKLSEIVSSITVLKLLFFVAALFLMIPLLFFFEDAAKDKILYMTTLWVCVNEVLFPSFYFQGIEKMRYFAIISIITRSISVALIFIFIKSKEDYLLVPFFYLLGALLSGISALYIIFYSHNLKFSVPTISVLKKYLNDTLPYFLTSLSANIYVTSNKVLIGLFLGVKEVSYYDMGEKILNILKLPIGILSQSLLPKISNEKNLVFINRILKYSFSFNVILYVGLFIFSNFVVNLLGGEQMLPAVWVVRILGLTLPIVAISNVFGTLTLVPFGYNKTFTKIIMLSAVFFMIAFLFLWFYDLITIYTLCGVTVLTEVFVSCLTFYHCKKNNLWLIKNTII